MNRVPQCCQQRGVQIGVGVETTAPVALASPGPIGKAAARLLYKKDPGRVVPDMAALHQEAVDLTAYKFNERKGALGSACCSGRETTAGFVIERIKHGVAQTGCGADGESRRRTFLTWPRRLKRTATSDCPPAAFQCWRGNDCEFGGPVDL